MVYGFTDPRAEVRIDGRLVVVESSGEFRKLVAYRELPNNQLVVRADNANGHTEVVRCFIVDELPQR